MELVVTLHAIKPVRIAITVEKIVVVRANDILDAEKRVGLVGGRVPVWVIAEGVRPRLSSRQVDFDSAAMVVPFAG
jgi:hypothetical protein